MHLPWDHKICAICLENNQLTREHVIPKVIGGILCSKFICKNCNSKFGHNFENSIKDAPEIRIAINALADKIPELFEQYERGQKFTVQFGEHKLIQKLDSKGILSEGTLDDGSLIVPEERTENHLRKLLKKDGKSESEIKHSLELWKKSDSGNLIQLSKNLHIKKWDDHPSEPLLMNGSVNTLVILKIIYEFIVLSVGLPALESSEPLSNLRKTLSSNDVSAADNLVHRYFAQQEYKSFHGIAFEGNLPFARFEVRLFGKLAYLINIPNLEIGMEPFRYTHDLITNNQSITEFKRDD